MAEIIEPISHLEKVIAKYSGGGGSSLIIDDTNISNTTTYSSEKIEGKFNVVDDSINGVVTENLNGKKLIPKTQSEYDALSDSEKNREDIIYLITDYTGGGSGGSDQPQETLPALRTRLKLSIKKSIDSATGGVIDDTKKACTDDFIEVTPASVLEFNYNGLWGVARGYREDKSFVSTINAINEDNDPMFSPVAIHAQGKYTIPSSVKYIKIVLALNSYAGTDISQASLVAGYDIRVGNKIYNTVAY